MLLKDKIAIVTGAGTGMGKAIALRYAKEGAHVVVAEVNEATGQQTAAEVSAHDRRGLFVKTDMSKLDSINAMIAKTVETFGRIDILVANSGIQKDAAIADMTLDDWNSVIEVNLTGQFLCAREAVRRFRSQPADGRPARSAGTIIAMSSVHEVIPWAGHVNYASAKGGIRMLTRSLAQEVAADGIRVNAIAPGAIRTPINTEAWDSEDALARLLRLIPYGRIGEPEDVARAAVWLASDAADYVTGTTLFVDGGMSLYPEFRDNG